MKIIIALALLVLPMSVNGMTMQEQSYFQSQIQIISEQIRLIELALLRLNSIQYMPTSYYTPAINSIGGSPVITSQGNGGVNPSDHLEATAVKEN